MAETSSIAWTNATFNPWIGCQRVAQGCVNCYAEAYANRYGKARWGAEGTRVKTSPAYWKQPLKWNRLAQCNCGAAGHGPGECQWCAGGCQRPRVFCASLADVFEDWSNEEGPLPIYNHKGEVCYFDGGKWTFDRRGDSSRRFATLDDLRRDLFALIDATPNLDWLLLTKRPENVRKMWPFYCDPDIDNDEFLGRSSQALSGPCYRPNVWLLTSASTQADYDRNAHYLYHGCRDLVPVLGLSLEPLLEPIKLWHDFDGETTRNWRGCFDWIIGGMESGPNRRDPGVETLCDLATQCLAAGVPFFTKQDCAQHSGEQGRIPDSVWALKQFPEVKVLA